MDLNFKIQYKKGSSNAATDALYRCPNHSILHVVSVSNPSWMHNLQEGYLDYPEDKQLLIELAIMSPNEKSVFSSEWLNQMQGQSLDRQQQVAQTHMLQSLHSSGIGGHKIKYMFAWPKLKAAVSSFVQACQVCQQAKVEYVKLPRLLQPLPIPEQAWATVSLYFIEGLPKSGKFDVILVVVDNFSIYGHFIPMSHPYTTLQVA